VTNKSRLRIPSGLALVLLVCLGSWSGARAEDGRNDVLAPLPLVLKDYEAFVQKLAGEVDGDEAAMATKLRSLGFSCTPVTKSIAFSCVRFGCRRGGLLMRGSLLQWTVDRFSHFSGKTEFSGAAIDYSWAARCYPEKEIEEAQKRFLSRHRPTQ
jgi:hypothetical protein